MPMTERTYRGPVESLRGQDALVVDAEPGRVQAQFNQGRGPLRHPDGADLTRGWHRFRAADFAPLGSV